VGSKISLNFLLIIFSPRKAKKRENEDEEDVNTIKRMKNELRMKRIMKAQAEANQE
jgi:hypothetical protein